LFEQVIDLPVEQRKQYIQDYCGDHEALYRLSCELIDSFEAMQDSTLNVDDQLVHNILADRIDANDAKAQNSALLDDSAVISESLNNYQLIKKIGEGGMGSVYLARRHGENFEQTVAIKVLRGGLKSELARERFHQERQILARLDHPSITRLIDGGSLNDGRPYLVMAYTPGIPITEYCQQQGQKLEQRLRLFMKLAEAISHAHQNLIIHRDIKPPNVLVANNGEIRLLDFGIAKLQQDEQLDTRTGMMVLTPEYASPEHISGKPVSVASDVYSLGVLLYELLCGVRPFNWRDHTPGEYEQLVQNTEPPPPSRVAVEEKSAEIAASMAVTVSTLKRQLQGELDNILLKALQSDTQQRYHSVAEFSDDIRRYLDGEAVLAHPPGLLYKSSKFISRYRYAVVAAFSIFAMLTVFGLYSYIQSQRLSVQAAELAEQRDQALREQQRAETISDFLVDSFTQADPTKTLGKSLTADQILEATVSRLTRNAYPDPELHAKLILSIAEVYEGLGLPEKASELVENLDIELISNRTKTTVLQQQAKLISSNGDHEHAIHLIEEALSLANQPDSALTSVELNQLILFKAILVDELGDYETAEHMLKNLIQEIELEQDAEFYLSACHRHADLLVYRSMSLEKGISNLSHCIKSVEESGLGTNLDWIISVSKISLAKYYRRNKNLEQAAELTQNALNLRLGIFGPNHITPTSTMINMGSIEYARKNYRTALDYYQQALTVQNKYYGEDSFRTSSLNHNISLTSHRLGRLESAQAHSQKAIENFRLADRHEHNNMAFYQNQLADVLIDMGQLAQAEAAVQSSIDILEKINYPKGRQLAKSRARLAQVYYEQSRFSEAQVLLNLAIPVLQKHYPDSDKTRQSAQQLLELLLGV